MERVMGIGPTPSAWKAEVLPLNYTRIPVSKMEGVGFEPTKAEPSDLQSDPFGRSGTPPKNRALNSASGTSLCQQNAAFFYIINATLSYPVFPILFFILFTRSKNSGAGGRNRTDDLLITNQLLYRLSYASTCLKPRYQDPYGGQFYAIKVFIANKNNCLFTKI